MNDQQRQQVTLGRRTNVTLGFVITNALILVGGGFYVHNWTVDDAVRNANICAEIRSLTEAVKGPESWRRARMGRWIEETEAINPNWKGASVHDIP